MIRYNVGGRELALAFTLSAMAEMEEAFGEEGLISNGGLGTTTIKGKNLAKTIEILANTGEELEGRERNVTAHWVALHIRPGRLLDAQKAVFAALQDGMRMENDEDNGDEEVDEVLEELRKKDGRVG